MTRGREVRLAITGALLVQLAGIVLGWGGGPVVVADPGQQAQLSGPPEMGDETCVWIGGVLYCW